MSLEKSISDLRESSVSALEANQTPLGSGGLAWVEQLGCHYSTRVSSLALSFLGAFCSDR